MRNIANIVCYAGGKLMLGFLLVCCVGFASAQNYSPFSGGTHYSNGLSVSSLNNDHVAGQAGSTGRYSGLSGGRTTFDPGYQLSGGLPKSIIQNPYFAEQDHNWNNDEAAMQLRAGGMTGFDPSEEDRLPLGEPIVPLMLMLCGYAAWKRRQSRRETE